MPKKTNRGTAFALIMMALIALGVVAAGLTQPTAGAQSDENGGNYCVDCHTSEPLLRALAVEDEETGEELSQGPG